MSHQVLARKWRPRVFADVIGQEHVVRAMANALDSGRIHHAYLLTGTRGVGKTTLARILAKALNCETGVTSKPCGVCRACTEIDAGRFVDLLEVDAATNTKVDEMRELLETAQYAPVSGRYKVYIIDEVHMLSKSAFNAMLKTLEEPPGHVEFILATTDPQKLPITVLSRCLQFNLKNLPAPLIAMHLAKVLEAEGVAFDRPALDLIGRAAEGSVRDSLSLLDQAIAHGAGEVRDAGVAAMLGALDQTYLFTLLEAVAQRDAVALLAEIEALASRSVSFDATLKDIAAILSRAALLQQAPDALSDHPDAPRLRELASQLTAEAVQLFYQIALLGRRDLALAPDEQSGFTMTLLRMLAFFPGGVASTAPEMSPPRARPANRPVEPTAPIAAPVRGASAVVAPPVAAKPAKAEASEGAARNESAIADWPRFVAGLQLSGLAGMLAKQCTMKAYANGVLDLVLPAGQRHLAEKVYVDKLRGELVPHLGGRLRLNVVVGGTEGMSLAAQEQQQRDDRQSTAESAVGNDPFVRSLMQDFGAEIIQDSIRPANAQ